MVTVSRFGFATTAFLARIVSRAPILDPTPLRGISVAANFANITGQDLPLLEDRTAAVISSPNCPGVSFMCNLTLPVTSPSWILCSNIVGPADLLVVNGCELRLSIARGPFRSSNTSIGVIVVPATIEPSDPYQVSFIPPNFVATINGTNLPLSAGNATATITLDGDFCANKTSFVARITPSSSSRMGISASIDNSTDSCRVTLTVDQFGISSASAQVIGQVIADISLVPDFESVVTLESQTYFVNVSGTNLPRDALEPVQLTLSSQACPSAISSLSCTGLVVTGGYVSCNLGLPVQWHGQLDNCDLNAQLIRQSGTGSLALSIQRLVAAPIVQSRAITIVSADQVEVIISGARLPLISDDWDASAVLLGSDCPEPLLISKELNASSSSIVLNLNISQSADSCTLAVEVSRFGQSSGFVSQGGVISRPVTESSTLEIVSERTMAYILSGQYFPRTGDTWNVALMVVGNCTDLNSVSCESPSILISGRSVSCSIYIVSGVGCNISAVVTRNSVSSLAILAAKVIRPRIFKFRVSLDNLPSAAQTDNIARRIEQILNASPINLTISGVLARSLLAEVAVEVPNTPTLEALQSNSTLQDLISSAVIAVMNLPPDQPPTNQPPTDQPNAAQPPVQSGQPNQAPFAETSPSTSPSPTMSPSPTAQPSTSAPSIDSLSNGGTIGTGAIAGIIVGAIVFIAIVIAVVIIIVVRRRKRDDGSAAKMKAVNQHAIESSDSSSSFESSEDVESSAEISESPEDDDSADYSSSSAASTSVHSPVEGSSSSFGGENGNSGGTEGSTASDSNVSESFSSSGSYSSYSEQSEQSERSE
jgi:hypothetical protein